MYRPLCVLFALVACLPTLEAQGELAADDVLSYRIQMGVGATSEEVWDGAVTVSSGELLGLRNWRPRPEDQLIGRNEWKLTSHKMVNFPWRAYEHPVNEGVRPYWWVRGVIVDLEAQAGTRVNVRTQQGRFSFNINEIPFGQTKSFLDGRVLVDRVPPAERLSDSSYESDFVTMLSGAGGEVWSAWVGYQGGANYVLARRFDGREWGPVQRVTEKPGDIFLVKLGRDIKGRPWAV